MLAYDDDRAIFPMWEIAALVERLEGHDLRTEMEVLGLLYELRPPNHLTHTEMKKISPACAVAIAISLAPLSLPALENVHPYCLYSCPSGAPATNNLIVTEIYMLSSNDTTKFADWVAYRITKKSIGPTRERTWAPDPLLDEAETLEPADYKDAHAILGTDPGHQVPLEHFAGTPHWRDTNYLSNITPQKSALNEGPWARLEQAARDLAQQEGVEAVYGMTGPLYERRMPRLPRADEPHLVPSAYWKILAVQYEATIATIQVAAFILDQNTPRHADYCTHLAMVDEIEQRSGLDFFHGLREAQEERLEGRPGALAATLGCVGFSPLTP